jgi:hypothetical protein
VSAATCCWCKSPLVQAEGVWWCGNVADASCRLKQSDHAVARIDRKTERRVGWLYVPTPKQAEFAGHPAKNRLFGGAAGPGKSHAARWSIYRKCMSIQGFEALIIRKTMPELKKSHIRKLRRDRQVLGGDEVTDWNKTDSILTFKQTDAILEFGHMGDEDAVDKYLSSEYDEICADEGSTFDGEVLMELSTRARTSKPEVAAAGGAKFDVVTNPGGPGWATLRDFFIHHTPDLERYPALKERYRPDQWAYIKALLDDNPYRDADYEDTLAVLNEARYRQLRWGDEDVFDGMFFSEWREHVDGRPHHVERMFG